MYNFLLGFTAIGQLPHSMLIEHFYNCRVMVMDPHLIV